MFRNVPRGIKTVAIINLVINFLLLIPSCFLLMFSPPIFGPIGLIVVLSNIILGFGILFLKNWARIIFIIMQIISPILSIFPFLIFLQFGLGNPTGFGDTYEAWEVPFTAGFFVQLISFIAGMSIPALPMLFSLFCVVYFLCPNVKKQFKVTHQTAL